MTCTKTELVMKQNALRGTEADCWPNGSVHKRVDFKATRMQVLCGISSNILPDFRPRHVQSSDRKKKTYFHFFHIQQ
uniref:Uncharacterized protein n=1 Tax=Kalanchoe fedtschenkoi TaxID=63787 RepID=A0A7N1A5X7_KALFE